MIMKRNNQGMTKVGILVQIAPVKIAHSYREPIGIRYSVRNELGEDIYLVEGLQYYILEEDNALNISLAEIKIPENIDIYGYVVPKLRKLRKKKEIRGAIKVSMPLKETILNPKNEPEESEKELLGSIKVNLTVGYGLEKFTLKPTSYNLAREFLKWQKLVKSNLVSITISN